jgi:hypothetical protein
VEFSGAVVARRWLLSYESGVAHRGTLTEQQLSILRWISNGCPTGVMKGYSHRVSAAALRSRGLVSTSGRGRTWTARVTANGSAYLERVESADPPIARQANLSVTEQLVADVVSAGGSLRLPAKRWNDPTAIDYAQRARLAQRHRKVPVGKRLTARHVGDEIEIVLVDAPELAEIAPLVAIDVPDRVGRYHEVAREYRDAKERHEVSRALLGRATRINPCRRGRGRTTAMDSSLPGVVSGWL